VPPRVTGHKHPLVADGGDPGDSVPTDEKFAVPVGVAGPVTE